MDSNVLKIELNSDHKTCIVRLINLIIAKSPHLKELKSDSIVFVRLVSVISLIETTLCSKYQMVLKRNSTHSQSIHVIKSWLKQYYKQEFVDSLCQTIDYQINETIVDNNCVNNNNNSNENNAENCDEVKSDTDITDINDINVNTNNSYNSSQNNNNIDEDIAVMSLMILSIAHKLRQSLPRINAYLGPEWQTLSELDHTLHEMTHCDKLLELVQNELCIKRKQLEVTRSKVSSLQSTLNSKILQVNKQKKTKLDYHSNLFAEYEDNGDNEEKSLVVFGQIENELSENSNDSEVFLDNPSDDDYVPAGKAINEKSTRSSTKRTPKKRKSQEIAIIKKPYRGRGRPPKALNPIRITPNATPTKSGSKGRGRAQKARLTPLSIDTDMEGGIEGPNDPNGPFECDVCGKQFAKEYRLTRHSFTHTGHKQFQCDFPNCLESFDLKWKLLDHKLEHNGFAVNDEDDGYGNSIQYFQCEWADCGESFPSKRELTLHEHELHANRSTSKYSCDWPQCKEIFENKIDWRKHVKTHGKIVPTECGFPGCHKSFFKLDSLENHRKIHETFTLNELS